MEKLQKLLDSGLTPKKIEKLAGLSNGSVKRVLQNKRMRKTTKEKIETLWEKNVETLVTTMPKAKTQEEQKRKQGV